MVGTTGLVAVFVRATLRGERPSAVQAATGFLYLAVITALTAEFAAKVKRDHDTWGKLIRDAGLKSAN